MTFILLSRTTRPEQLPPIVTWSPRPVGCTLAPLELRDAGGPDANAA